MGATPALPGNNDTDTSIADLKARVRDSVLKREWLPYHHPKELAVSIAIEAAELLEIFQWEEKQPLERLKEDAETRRRLQDEIADVQIFEQNILPAASMVAALAESPLRAGCVRHQGVVGSRAAADYDRMIPAVGHVAEIAAITAAHLGQHPV